MNNLIKGLHHVTSLASDATRNNAFFTEALGLRRIKKTVNFDEPSVYHLYYGDEKGSPGSVMTYFPFPNIRKGQAGAGEVGSTNFSVPEGSLEFWQHRFTEKNISTFGANDAFDEKRLSFTGPDGEIFTLIETPSDPRTPWLSQIQKDEAIRGFHSASMRLKDKTAMQELLQFMGYGVDETHGDTTRLSVDGDAATIIELVEDKTMPMAQQGAGSVHHIAFAVENRQAQLDIRKALMDTGYQITPVIDRDYFWAIYFRAPGGVLFEIATNEPGFERDEPLAELGENLKLPTKHEHLRQKLEQYLEPIQ